MPVSLPTTRRTQPMRAMQPAPKAWDFRHLSKGLVLLALMLLTAIVWGHGRRRAEAPRYDQPRRDCSLITGTVHLPDGSPLTGARIRLHPLTDSDLSQWPCGFPRATVAADGSFRIGTYEVADGAPPGRYSILVTWRPTDGRTSDDEEYRRDRYRGRFNHPGRSPWWLVLGPTPRRLELVVPQP